MSKGCRNVFDFIDENYGVLRLQCGVWTDLNYLSNGASFMKMELCKQCSKKDTTGQHKKKTITDDDGIVYEEVSYQKYLDNPNKHRIVKSLNSQYFVEVEK